MTVGKDDAPVDLHLEGSKVKPSAAHEAVAERRVGRWNVRCRRRCGRRFGNRRLESSDRGGNAPHQYGFLPTTFDWISPLSSNSWL